MSIPANELSDHALAERAQAGDREAFAELYERYFPAVYDFLVRTMKDPDEAGDVAQDAFLNAMNHIGGLTDTSKFKSWLFTIARNGALRRLQRSGRQRSWPSTEEGTDEIPFDLVDTDRLSDPAQAAEANEAAAIVWEAANGLDADAYSLLDLHVRQGMQANEIAGVLEITRNNANVRLSRLRRTMERATTALFLLPEKGNRCVALDVQLREYDSTTLSLDTQRVIEEHAAACEECGERRRRLVTPLAAFAGLAPVTAPAGLQDSLRGRLMEEWPSGGSGVRAGLGGHGSRIGFVAGGTIVAAVSIALLAWLGMPSFGGESNESAAPADGLPTAPVASSPTAPSVTQNPTFQANATDGPSATVPPDRTNTPESAPTAGSGSDTTSAAGTAVPGTPTLGPAATAQPTLTPQATLPAPTITPAASTTPDATAQPSPSSIPPTPTVAQPPSPTPPPATPCTAPQGQDRDCDGFADSVELGYGSDPDEGKSTPEHSDYDAKVGASTCSDGLDNDVDQTTDAADAGCN